MSRPNQVVSLGNEKMRFARCLPALLLWGLCAGCGGDAASDDPQTARLSIEGFSSFDKAPFNESSRPANNSLRLDDPRGTVYSLTAAKLRLDSIALTFSKDLSCSDIDYLDPAMSKALECDAHRLVIRGPFEVDLVHGRKHSPRSARSTPATSSNQATSSTLASWVVPALDYRRVELRFAPILTRPNPESTLVARASYEAGGSIGELVVRFEFRATAEAAIDVPLQPGESLALGLDVANWLDQIPVTRCIERGHLRELDGNVVLNSDLDARPVAYFYHDPPVDCADAQQRFRNNLVNSLRLKIEAP